MSRSVSMRQALCLLVACFLVLLLFLAAPYRHDAQDLLSYSTRPLWDKSEAPQQMLAHLQSPNVPANNTAACLRHGWQTRPSPQPMLWDATLFSTELDLLEIRLTELWDVVDLFLILESTHTMTGTEKRQLLLRDNIERFKPWASKLRYSLHQGRASRPGDGLFSLANEQRQAMSNFINEQRPPEDALVLMADIDEIPYAATLDLLKTCEAPLPIHLQLQNYIYSFEFPTLADSWRAQVHRWSTISPAGGYKHGLSSDRILASSGWHCSFCFRTLAEFSFKMLSASHVDRLLKRPHYQQLLSHSSIQDHICKGKDLYDMLPEAYSWADLIGFWGGAKQQMGSPNLPAIVVTEWQRFAYLLPGGCKREPGDLATVSR